MRLLHDWLRIELEPPKQMVGSIIIPDPETEPIRLGKVMSVGPGRCSASGARRTLGVKVGERVAFHMANLQTKQGRDLVYRLSANQGLIRESDVFFVVEGEAEVSL